MKKKIKKQKPADLIATLTNGRRWGFDYRGRFDSRGSGGSDGPEMLFQARKRGRAKEDYWIHLTGGTEGFMCRAYDGNDQVPFADLGIEKIEFGR